MNKEVGTVVLTPDGAGKITRDFWRKGQHYCLVGGTIYSEESLTTLELSLGDFRREMTIRFLLSDENFVDELEAELTRIRTQGVDAESIIRLVVNAI